MGNSSKEEIKSEVTKGLEKLGTLRDEVKLHLHLATLDAKTEWNEKLEPRIDEALQSAQQLTHGSSTVIQDVLGRVEAFLEKLRETGRFIQAVTVAEVRRSRPTARRALGLRSGAAGRRPEGHLA